jgi:hypothetical protein
MMERTPAPRKGISYKEIGPVESGPRNFRCKMENPGASPGVDQISNNYRLTEKRQSV